MATVLALATLTLLVWLCLGPANAVEHTAALLIVACPCALGLATPLAVAAIIAVAMAGSISPLLAAVLMPLSSLTVVISSYLARTF